MNSPAFPRWYRPLRILPALVLAYIIIPLAFTFSPDALTQELPGFLLGATDWGTGNIYTFGKLVLWLGLVLGALANGRFGPPAGLDARGVFRWRLAANRWHIAFAPALLLPSIPVMLEKLATGTATLANYTWVDSLDMWLLTGAFLLGVLVVLAILSPGQTQPLPSRMRKTLSLLVAIGWGFIPYALGRP